MCPMACHGWGGSVLRYGKWEAEGFLETRIPAPAFFLITSRGSATSVLSDDWPKLSQSRNPLLCLSSFKTNGPKFHFGPRRVLMLFLF